MRQRVAICRQLARLVDDMVGSTISWRLSVTLKKNRNVETV